MAAPIAVEDGLVDGAGLERLVEGGEDEIGAQVVGQTPADDAARADVDDDGQVKQPALVGMKVISPAQARSGTFGRGWSASRLGEGLSARPSLVLGTNVFG